MKDNVLYAFYDLATSPVTFDVVKFLILAELARRRENCDGLHVVIVPGPKGGFRDDHFTPYDTADKQWRLRNLVLPCCWLVPSCQQLTVSGSRYEAERQTNGGHRLFPEDYSVHHPTERYDYLRVHQAAQQSLLPSLSATARALTLVEEWAEKHAAGRKVVTITLRECAYEKSRNSRLPEWAAFARMLDTDVYYPLLIRDTMAALQPFPETLRGLNVSTDISWNLELRAALYQTSYLNLFQNCGPYVLSAFNRQSRYINTTQANVADSGATSTAHLRSQGIKPGEHQNLWSTPVQELVWQDDLAGYIYPAFTRMCRRIEYFEHASLPELEAAFLDYVDQRLWHRAEWVSEQAVNRFGQQAGSWLMRARVLHKLNQATDALQCVRRAIQIEESPEAFTELVRIGASLNMSREVEQINQYAQKKYPGWEGLPAVASS
jgi:hypothetical protein